MIDEKPPVTKQEQPTINIADARLTAIPDGSGAIAQFSIMGAFNVTIAFPPAVVDDFMAQWIKVKQDQASFARLLTKVQRSKA